MSIPLFVVSAGPAMNTGRRISQRQIEVTVGKLQPVAYDVNRDGSITAR